MAKINILNPYNFKTLPTDVDFRFYVQASVSYVSFLEHWLVTTDPVLINDRGLELIRAELLKGGEIADILIDTRENFIVRLNSVEGCEHFIFIAHFGSDLSHNKRYCLEPFTYPVKLVNDPSYEGGSHKNTDLAASIVEILLNDAKKHVHKPVICDITWFNALEHGRVILNLAKAMKNIMIYESGV